MIVFLCKSVCGHVRVRVCACVCVRVCVCLFCACVCLIVFVCVCVCVCVYVSTLHQSYARTITCSIENACDGLDEFRCSGVQVFTSQIRRFHRDAHGHATCLQNGELAIIKVGMQLE